MMNRNKPAQGYVYVYVHYSYRMLVHEELLLWENIPGREQRYIARSSTKRAPLEN